MSTVTPLIDRVEDLWPDGSAPSPADSSQKMRKSSNGLTDPTIRSSSAYLRLLK